MYCQYCKTKLEEDAKVCSFCGNPTTRQGAKELDEEETKQQIQDFSKMMASMRMADRYHISSVILFVFGAICAFFALLMVLAPTVKIENIKGAFGDVAYCRSMALLHGTTALFGFVWAGMRYFGKMKMLREKNYSTKSVICSSLAFCILLLVRVFLHLYVKNAADVLFMFLSAIVFMYEIFFVMLFAKNGAEDIDMNMGE